MWMNNLYYRWSEITPVAQILGEKFLLIKMEKQVVLE